MILVSYDPFQIDGGVIYRLKENGQIIDKIDGLSSTINDLAKVSAKYSHTENDYEINFKSEFPHDMAEFTNAIDYYEMLNYKENKIVVKEIL